MHALGQPSGNTASHPMEQYMQTLHNSSRSGGQSMMSTLEHGAMDLWHQYQHQQHPQHPQQQFQQNYAAQVPSNSAGSGGQLVLSTLEHGAAIGDSAAPAAAVPSTATPASFDRSDEYFWRRVVDVELVGTRTYEFWWTVV
ncbi:hypothetical protein GYMLUDRAFT_46966 [Collybiopsis luxurians FD-317 M1]|uniref:Uncharacterized protein n=1 Tax=Collybiopsis luxurians FD-317 M1 TaxID=944289 RepID=A0A0D0BNR5_9AGAR|nr:hypothetical protein GYMLUDRAFT_46966 [Collybiopsis luxurians FD-317 M1]